MAISAISSIGSSSLSSLWRVEGLGRKPRLEALEPIPALEPRSGQKEDEGEKKAEADILAPTAEETGLQPPPYDRRSASELLAKARETREENLRPDAKPSERELRDRLADLQAEKAQTLRRRSGGQASQSAEIMRALTALRSRDAEVRSHESAHIAAGGRYITGGASYSYQRGPDGKHYAVGGEVGIDSSPVPGKPEETLAKMRIVRAAALAPAEPSGADMAVAGAASQAEAQAVAELAEQRKAELAGDDGSGSSAETGKVEERRESEERDGGVFAYRRWGSVKNEEAGRLLDIVA